MGIPEIVALVTQAGANGILAAAVLWLAPKALKSSAESREKASRQHTADVNRICEVFQEVVDRSNALHVQQLTAEREMWRQEAKYEREQCQAQFELVVDRIQANHQETLRAIEGLSRGR